MIKPMWDDTKTDETGEPAVSATPMTKDQLATLRSGDAVRVVTPAGAVYEGLVEKHSGGSRQHFALHVCGKVFYTGYHTIFAVDPTSLVPQVAPRRALSPEEVRDIVADLSGISLGRPSTVSPSSIAIRAIGFDPTVGMTVAVYGGKSNEGWMNQFLSMSALKRTLGKLVEDDVLVKAVASAYQKPSVDDMYVSFGMSRTGYVLRSAYDESVAARKAEKREQVEAALLKQARETVATRHADEVTAELLRLLAEAGI